MDLVGAGLGALGMVFLLDALTLADALRTVGLAGAASRRDRPAVGVRAGRLARGGALLVLCAGLALPAALPESWLRPHPSPYKGLSLALTAPDARIVAERHGPLGWLAAVESPRVPFRHAPGLSLLAPAGPPAQLGLFSDGGAPSAITRADADLRYLEAETAALPYHLVERPRALVLGAGGGAEVLRGAPPRRGRGGCGGTEPRRARARARGARRRGGGRVGRRARPHPRGRCPQLRRARARSGGT